MNSTELNELSKLARHDGQRLFEVAETLNKLGLVGIVILALAGVIAAWGATENAGLNAGIFVIVITCLICWFLYLGLVLTTSLSKVFVHILFSTLATCENSNINNSTSFQKDEK
jgi:hypothetical protein